MPFLIKNIDNDTIHYLINKNEFVVGRKDCDILIENDKSISRVHAKIRLKDGKVTLEDCGSKYHTLYKDTELKPNVEVMLEVNDEFQFGIIDSKFRLEEYKFITTATCLNSIQKTELVKNLSTIGGKYVENWSDACTHLTVEKIKLTVKVLHALVDGKPIVLPTYWTKYAENARKGLPPPNIEEYNNPPLAEALLSRLDLKTNPERKMLFKGKVFVFLKEKDRKQMEDIIRKAGGTSLSWENNPIPIEDINRSPKEFLIMETRSTELNTPQQSSLKQVIKEMSKQGKRTIPLQEIAMALVLCSCEKECNPSFNRAKLVFPTTKPKEPTQNNAILPETQSENFTVSYNTENDEHLFIPETIAPSLSLHIKHSLSTINNEEETQKDSGKRIRNDHFEENASKKTKLEKESIVSEKAQTSTVEEKKIDNVTSKCNLSQKRKAKEETKTNKNDSEDSERLNPFVNKNKKVKIDPKVNANNPFKKIVKLTNDVSQISDQNPFLSETEKKKRDSDHLVSDSPIAKKKKDKNETRIFSSTALDNNLDKSAGCSTISKLHTSRANDTWLSRNTKLEKKEDIENNYIEPEMLEFAKKFKDAFIVEVTANVTIREISHADEVDGGHLRNGRPNFKRFKKVKPLRPQIEIIGKDTFVEMDPETTTSIVDNRRTVSVFDDEDDQATKAKKKAPRKFYI